MKQRIFILFFVLLSPFVTISKEEHVRSELPSKGDERAIEPLAYQSYKQIRVGFIRRGYEITVPGNYTISDSQVLIRATDSPSVAGVNVGGAGDTRGIITINSSNVTLDLGGALFETEKEDLVGVTIADGVKNVTVRNGSFGSGSAQNFDSGIIVGQSCDNILIEDILVQGCDDTMGMTTTGAIAIKGATGNISSNVTLRNLVLSDNATRGLECSYCNDLRLENIQSNANDYMAAGGGMLMAGMTYPAVLDIYNCNRITGKNIEVNNNPLDGGGSIITFNTCNDINLENIAVTNNDDDAMMVMSNSIEGINIYSCSNVFLSYVNASNLADAEYGLKCDSSSNVTIEYLNVSNCTSIESSPDEAASVIIQGSQQVKINHATIANNTMANNFYGIKCIEKTVGMDNIANEGIFLDNIEIFNNSATDTSMMMNPETVYTAIDFQDTIVAHVTNSRISQNTGTLSFYGIRVSNDAQYFACDNVSITNNSTDADDLNNSIVAGIHCYDTDSTTNGIEIKNCNISGNNGAREIYGIYLRDSVYPLIDNCIVKGNVADTPDVPTTHKPSAGLFMQDCHYALVTNCSFINNKASDFAQAAAADQTNAMDFTTTTTIGAGIINLGKEATDPSTGNSFINCICNGNGTQLANSAPVGAYVDADPLAPVLLRHSTQHALAAGAANQWTKNTTYKNCTFNNNGISEYVVGSGLMIAQDNGGAGPSNRTIKTTVEGCTANNNSYFGFWDQGASQTGGGPYNCEMYFIQCLAISNGSGAAAAVQYLSAADKHRKNCFVYFSTGATSTVPPFIQLTFDDASDDLVTGANNNSPYINMSIIETS